MTLKIAENIRGYERPEQTAGATGHRCPVEGWYRRPAAICRKVSARDAKWDASNVREGIGHRGVLVPADLIDRELFSIPTSVPRRGDDVVRGVAGASGWWDTGATGSTGSR